MEAAAERHLLPDIVCGQEMRSRGEEAKGAARRWMKGLGFKAVTTDAMQTGEGPNAKAAGVLVGVRSYAGFARTGQSDLEQGDWLAPGGPDEVPARMVAGLVNAIVPGGLVVVSLYLKDGLKATGCNLEFLHILGAFLAKCGRPWIVAGDWNLNPAELRACGWLSQVSGDIVAPAGITCTSGDGDILDFYVVSAGLSSRCSAREAWTAAPSSPHSPVWLDICDVPEAAPIVQRIKWKVFPPRAPIGCRPPPLDSTWSWEPGEALSELHAPWKEWISHAERQWCQDFDLINDDAAAHCGRAAGYSTRTVPFDLVAKSARPPRTTKEARAWKSLRSLWGNLALAVQDIEYLGYGWGRRKKITMQISKLEHLGFERCDGDLVNYDRAKLVEKATFGSLRSVLNLKAEIGNAADAEWGRSVDASFQGWKSWAVDSVRGGAKAAHAFSCAANESPPDPMLAGLPVAGAQAMEACLKEWKPRWTDSARLAETKALLAIPRARAMEDITLAQLDELLATYPDSVGLGACCTHPKSIALLPPSFRLRFIDLMHTFERQPHLRPMDWLSLIVFLLKPTGGWRPIGLTMCVLRVWSRIRSAIAQGWERQHDERFFWGSKGKPCDVAGWCHNVLAGYARYIGMEVATLFGDIEKFYEFVSHEVLTNEADADGFPLDLLKALCGLYGGARVAVFDGMVSDAIDCGGTILAGCSCATTLAKVLVYRLLRSLNKKYCGLHIKNVVDDVSLQMIGTVKFIKENLGRAGLHFARGLQGLRLPLSVAKTSFVASSKELANTLEKEWAEFNFRAQDVCRNLGTDATAGRRRRVPTANKRLKGASARTKRLLRLRAAGANASYAQRSGPTSAGIWGGPVVGLTDAKLNGLRISALRAGGRLPKGASLGLRTQAGKASRRLDPFRIHSAQVVQRWAEAVWEGYPRGVILSKSLHGAKRRLASKVPMGHGLRPCGGLLAFHRASGLDCAERKFAGH